MRWIVTGGAGFIGKNLVIELLKRLEDVVVVDKVPYVASGYDEIEIVQDCIDHLTYLQRDLTKSRDLDFSEWFSPGGGDVVVHLAAMSGVKECSQVPLSAFYINLEAPFSILDAAADFCAKRFVFASSGAVVAGSPMLKPSEISPPRPVNVYGSMKAAAEQLCRGFSEERGLSTAALRFSNVYGPYSGHKTSAVHAFIQKMMAGEILKVHGDGKQTRDFVFVGDVVHAIIGAGVLTFDGTKTLHVSSGIETAVFDAADGDLSLYDEICEAIGEGEKPFDLVDQDPGVTRASLNSDFTRRFLCIGSPTPLGSGIRDTVAWYRKLAS
jgi:UDP-glucose 4-epimerase